MKTTEPIGTYIGVMVSMPNPLTGKTNTVFLPTDQAKVLRWLTDRKSCPLIQDMFPELDADQREFLMSGISGDDWAVLWPETDEMSVSGE